MRTTTTGRAGQSVALALLTTLLALAGCSSTSAGSYCDTLGSAEAEWKSAGATLADPVAATRFLTTVTRIEETAPDEVRADWESLHTLFQKFTVANPDLGALTKQMEGFESSAKRIETHARETCGIDLGS